MELIILYSTGCPNCIALKNELDKNKISYQIENNIDKIISLGISTVPTLEVEGHRMDKNEAVKWIKDGANI